PRCRRFGWTKWTDRLAIGGRVRELPADDLLDQLAKFPAGIRRAQCENRVQDRPEHVDVAALIDEIEFAARRLRRNVRRRADDEPVERREAAEIRGRDLQRPVAEVFGV